MPRIRAKIPDEVRFRSSDTPAARAQKLEILRQWVSNAIEKVEVPEIDLSGYGPRLLTIDTVTDTAYTFVNTDNYHHKRFTAGTAITATVPKNATKPIDIGVRIRITAAGAGQVTLVPEAGVTLRSRDGALKSTARYAVFEIEKVAVDEWDVLGDVSIN